MSHHPYRLTLASVALAIVLGPLGVSGVPAWADCSQADRNAGHCRSIDGSTQDNQVTIRVETSVPGNAGAPGGGAPAPSGSSGSAGITTGGGTSQSPGSQTTGSSATQSGSRPSSSSSRPVRRGQPPPPRTPVLGSSECQIRLGGLCRAQSPPRVQTTPSSAVTTSVTPARPAPPPPPPRPPTPPQSASELAAFQPDRPTLVSEPGDWSMPTLPTNFVARATTHTRSGQLAGWPVEVRFTPVRFHWDFGDRRQATFTDPGQTWATLGLKQFDPTPTSHTYARPGRYVTSVRVDYRVEFRFVGEAFQPVSGTVSSASENRTIRVLTVSPLLLG